ncbi:ABC transporter permease, partial [Mycoplasma wenyonii]|uniref:ABC transporter permease n=1 Tax=Mycoplasma wenyonii TaxID=65123 RepID=UPI0015ECB648
ESHTISSLISSFYFSEGGGEKNRQAMYVFGASLLVLSIFLNWFLRKKASELNYKGNLVSRKWDSLSWKIKSKIEHLRYKNSSIYLSRYLQKDVYSKKETTRNQFLRTFRAWREKTLVFLVLSLFLSILGVAIFRGLYFIFYNLFTGNTETYSLKGIVVPTWNTILLLFFSVSWSLPISFFSAFFVNIYLRKHKRIKSFFTSIISGIGTAPPMLWAMFSSFFFLNYLKLGIGKTSVFAGILSFTILSFPFLFNKFSNLFEAYSKKYSKALSYLGLQNFNLIYLLLRDGKSKIRKHLSNLTTKLNGESGLLFITMGVSPSSRFTLWGPGQTLTTKFFASFYKYKIVELKSVVYETIFFILIFSIFLYSLLTTFWIKLFKRGVRLVKKLYLKKIFNYYWHMNSKNKAKFLVQLSIQ